MLTYLSHLDSCFEQELLIKWWWSLSVYVHVLLLVEISDFSAEDTTDYLTPWSRVLVEKLIVAQLVKKFPWWNLNALYSQEFTTCPCFELDGSSSESISLRFTLILLFSHLFSGLSSICFPSGFNTKKFLCISHLSNRYSVPTHLILHDVMKHYDYEVPYYAYYSIILLLPLS